MFFNRETMLDMKVMFLYLKSVKKVKETFSRFSVKYPDFLPSVGLWLNFDLCSKHD